MTVSRKALETRRRTDEWMNYFVQGIQDRDQCLDRVRSAVALLRGINDGTVRRGQLQAPAIYTWIQQRATDEHAERLAGWIKPWPPEVPLRKIKAQALRQYLATARTSDEKAQGARSPDEAPDKRRVPLTYALLVVEYLMAHGFLPVAGVATVNGQSEQALAQALHAFFETNKHTRLSMKDQFEGHYLVYRRSAHWPGRYVKAALQIEPLPGRDADEGVTLRTIERHVHHGEDGSAGASETYIGVISRKSSYPFILSSLLDPANGERGAPRFTLIHSTVFKEGKGGRVASMVGITVSPFGQGQAWTSPVCIERCDDEPDVGALGLFSVACEAAPGVRRIPPSVVARLGRAAALSLQD